MGSSDYTRQLQQHYEGCWNSKARTLKWRSGPVEELPEDFSVLRFEPHAARNMWTYATCGMSLPTDEEPLELHLFSPVENPQLVELVTVITHYHRTGSFLGLGHTVNFGRPWLPGSGCDYGLVSLPYLDGPSLEWLEGEGFNTRFLWLVPITPAEVAYKKKHGLEAFEAKLEAASFNYLDPKRASVV
jgi:Suppressor of fused protein (SUFU)